MQSAIHDPYSIATPTQRHERAKRRERLRRLDKASLLFKIENGISKVYDEPCRLDKVDVLEPRDEWVARQKKIPIQKAPWFSIVSEVAPVEPARPLVEEIQKVVAKHYGVTRDDLICQRRTADIVRPRQVAMYLAKTLTLRSLPEIGRRFGQRDHTTILSGVRKITRLLPVDADLAATVASLSASLGASEASC